MTTAIIPFALVLAVFVAAAAHRMGYRDAEREVQPVLINYEQFRSTARECADALDTCVVRVREVAALCGSPKPQTPPR